jgi:DtxR family transcriptional regulator, Mn-dependent transcriptional regulator
MVKITRREDTQEEPLYLGTAESEHIEMYLKAIWFIRERGDEVKVSTIAQILNVTQPSVVQMLKKLDNLNLLDIHHGKLRSLKKESRLESKW